MSPFRYSLHNSRRPNERVVRPANFTSSSCLTTSRSHQPKPSRLSDHTLYTIQSSVSEKTQWREHRNVNQFLQYCFTRGLSKSDVLPPSADLLCDYAASFSGFKSGATARAHIRAVRKWVGRHRQLWFGDDLLERTLKGVSANTPCSSIRDKRIPVKVVHLDLLGEDFRRDRSHFKLCRNAAANILLYSQLRIGEVLADTSNPTKYCAARLPLVKDLSAPSESGSRILRLRKTKTQQVRGEEVSITALRAPSDPARALERHIRANKLGPDDPLFAFRNSSGSLTIMTKRSFLLSVNGVLASHGAPRVTGHCFRIGGTTHYLLSGVPPDVVKALGRWKSNAFLRYWREIDSLAEIHIPNVIRSRTLTSLHRNSHRAPSGHF